MEGECVASLTILRHAKAGWDAGIERDFDRPINDKGRLGAQLIAQWLAQQALPIDHIIASPARRVEDTLELMSGQAGAIAVEPHFDRRVYLASAASLVDIIREVGSDVRDLMIVGHNPGLEDLVLKLARPNDAAGYYASVEEKFPTCTLARIALDSPDWSAVGPGCGTLTHVVRPRDLDPALGPSDD